MRPARTSSLNRASACMSRAASSPLRDVMSFLSDNFSWDDCTPAGELELVKNNGETVQCMLILMSEWRVKLPTHLRSDHAR